MPLPVSDPFLAFRCIFSPFHRRALGLRFLTCFFFKLLSHKKLGNSDSYRVPEVAKIKSEQKLREVKKKIG
jgi:hypothetical protein